MAFVKRFFLLSFTFKISVFDSFNVVTLTFGIHFYYWSYYVSRNCMLRHTEEISKLREDEEAKLRKMENKYKLEMSDLRIYFENSYTDYLKQ